MFADRSLCAAVARAFVWIPGLILAAIAPARAADDALRIHTSSRTGRATFLTAATADAIPVELQTGQAEPRPGDFLRQHAHHFGVTDPATQLRETRVHHDRLGWTHITYEQMHQGVPVFTGILKVHQAPGGGVAAANGLFHSIPAYLDLTPSVSARTAVATACTDLGTTQPPMDGPTLTIVDPAWYGDPSAGVRLAYHLVLADWAIPAQEAYLIDAHTNEILDRWSLVQTARWREVYDAQTGSDLPGILARVEGDPPVISPEEVDRAYDYLGDTYDYFDRAFGRDGIDDAGLPLSVTANYDSIDYCPNAYWDTSLKRMVFCIGAVTDDVLAHEMTHGITQHTANLIYQNQSGQLNESFSDVFGELVDMFNGDVAFVGPPTGPPYWPTHPTGPGTDTPNNLRAACSPAPDYADGVRWMVGEDAVSFGGAVRDMWYPVCEGDPDYANSLLQKCLPWDNGGVHSGSGVPNHAFAMLVDGQIFNGHTVTGIGPVKAGAVWYRALTVYLSRASDFRDAYLCLNQAAQDLIGTCPNDPRTGLPIAEPFTAADAEQVDLALRAVEMDTPGRCGAMVGEYDLEPPTECPTQHVFFEEDFEAGAPGWTTTTTAPPVGDGWVLADQLPALRPGTAWFVGNVATGEPLGGAESRLFSPLIDVPAQVLSPRLSWTQYIGSDRYGDGGNLSISVNGGPWTLIPTCLYEYNPPHWVSIDNQVIVYNEPMFSGIGAGWFTSVVDLAPLVVGGDTIQLRFNLGDRYYGGGHGWFVDDVKLYACTCTQLEDCARGPFCDGLPDCSGGYCNSVDPCPAQACDESTATCLPTVFHDDFESGNSLGWDLRGPGSTAVEGDWVIGDPNGMFYLSHPIQSMTAYRGCGCVFTGENPSQYYNGDVDEGVTYLVSPAIDLSGQSYAALSFAWWFVMFDPSSEMTGAFTVDASPDDGATWYPVDTRTDGELDGAWYTADYRLEAVIPLTERVRLRFGAEERTETMSDLIEVALDDVAVTLVDLCAVGPGDQDCNTNGRQDWCDLADGVSPDCNGNAIPDECEIAAGTAEDCQPNGILDECEITPVSFSYEFLMDTDPGWATEGLWQWGRPLGGGDPAGGFDPHFGHTGENVYGYNLDGHYEAGIPEYHLTTTAIDCSLLENVQLSFWRWLYVEQPVYDHAAVRVSNDGQAWATIWENTDEIRDWPWLLQTYDISAYADRQATVYVLWTMGPTDESYQFCGWNLDDVTVSGDLITGAHGDCNANDRPDDCDAVTPGDFTADGYVALDDLTALVRALTGPDNAPDVTPEQCADLYLSAFDHDTDGDLDLADFAAFQRESPID